MSTVVSIDAGSPGPLDPDVLAAGSKAGPWVVERELGRGGMGAVYACVHEEIGKRAALKVVHRRLLSGFNPERMRLEAKLVNQVAHPGIVDIFETGSFPDGRPYIVMERLQGESLGERALRGKVRPDLAVAILKQVAEALIAAHAAGVVHRDLKLDNVFLVETAEGAPRAKLVDWGIAKDIHHDPHHTQDGQLVGTPQYVSPEQARGLDVTPQSDVYSLGIMAYELFLEELPFVADTAAEVLVMHLHAIPTPPHEIWPGIPPALEDLLVQMLAKKPGQRPTMTQVAERLAMIAAEMSLRAGTEPIVREPTITAKAISSVGLAPTEIPMTRTSPWAMTRKRWQYAAASMVVAAAASLVLVVRGGGSTANAATSAATASQASADPAPSAPELGAPPVVAPPAAVTAPIVERVEHRAATIAGARVQRAPQLKAPVVRKPVPAPRRGSAKPNFNGTLEVYPQ